MERDNGSLWRRQGLIGDAEVDSAPGRSRSSAIKADTFDVDLAGQRREAPEECDSTSPASDRLSHDDPVQPRLHPILFTERLAAPPRTLERRLDGVFNVSDVVANQGGEPDEPTVMVADEGDQLLVCRGHVELANAGLAEPTHDPRPASDLMLIQNPCDVQTGQNGRAV